SGRGMYRVYYRNRGGYGQWLGNVTVDATGADIAGLMWYELRDVGSGPRLWQSGTYSPDATHRWMGAIGTDRSGDIALGYSVSSATINPGVRYAVRTPADPLGTLQAEATLVNGTGSQLGGARWGDYSTMATDPVDDCTFWYTQEYGKVTGSFIWHSRIGSFKVPTCGPAPGNADLRVTQTATPNPGTVGQPLTYTVTVNNDGPGSATGVTLLEAVPTGATFGSATPSQGTCAAPANGLITCSLGALANGASATLTVVVTPTVEGSVVNAAGATAVENDPDPSDNSNALSVFVVGLADLSLTLGATDIVLPGENIEYAVKVVNQGPNSAFAVVYRQTLPAGTTFVPAAPCTAVGQVVTCTRAQLASNFQWSFTILADPSPSTGIVATTSGTVSSITPDPDSTDNLRTQKSIVVPSP
ncbi:MAG: hypothetical protein ACRDJM_07085, partial [Actinomycetota bacterium]